MSRSRQRTMNEATAKRIVHHAVAITEPRWRTYAVSWSRIDSVFLERGYEQQGFRCARLVQALEKHGVASIGALGSILDERASRARYDNKYAKGTDAPFYAQLRDGRFGENGRLFDEAVRAFLERDPGSGGRFFWMYLWSMLRACHYLREKHGSSFATYLLSEYRRFAGKADLAPTNFLAITGPEWREFLVRVKPWKPLPGIGVNVFDFIMGDVIEARFNDDSYKFDSANQYFLEVTGISALIAPFERERVIEFLRSLRLPYTLREVNKGIYTYCSDTEAENFGFCRSLRRCQECAVADLCEKRLGSPRVKRPDC